MGTRVDLTIDQGATFEFDFTINDSDGAVMDLSDYTARSQLRKHYTSTNAVSFNANIESNHVVLRLTAAQTANILAGRYVYDVEIEDSTNVVTRAIEGCITVNPNVTR